MSRFTAWLLLGATACGCLGCESKTPTADVSGAIKVAGETMGAGVVNFYPASGGRPIGVPVSASGQYAAELPPGEYTVVVMTSNVPPDGWKEGDPLPPPKVAVPVKYTQPRSSPLRITVAADDMSHDFTLE